MTVALHISPKLEEALRARAAATGQSVEQYLTAWLEREMAWDAARSAWEPAQRAAGLSQMSEEALAEILEAEKHALRREKRAS
ncbi:hypothetical protein LBMAG48_02610 [Phycisphaerae bacterium]|nr:hypothetical protein LBMAG48_02610 [Phycisphaerae bacterium]